MKYLKTLFLAAAVLFVRLIITKDQQVLSMVAAGNYKEILGFVKCLLLSRT